MNLLTVRQPPHVYHPGNIYNFHTKFIDSFIFRESYSERDKETKRFFNVSDELHF